MEQARRTIGDAGGRRCEHRRVDAKRDPPDAITTTSAQPWPQCRYRERGAGRDRIRERNRQTRLDPLDPVEATAVTDVWQAGQLAAADADHRRYAQDQADE